MSRQSGPTATNFLIDSANLLHRPMASSAEGAFPIKTAREGAAVTSLGFQGQNLHACCVICRITHKLALEAGNRDRAALVVSMKSRRRATFSLGNSPRVIFWTSAETTSAELIRDCRPSTPATRRLRIEKNAEEAGVWRCRERGGTSPPRRLPPFLTGFGR